MRDDKFTLMCALLAMSACSEAPAPTKIAEIGGAVTGAAFYMYRPGGTLDDYISLEIRRAGVRSTILSISRCSLAAAKVGDGMINTVLFGSDFSGKSHVITTGEATGERSLTTIIRSVNAAPTENEVAKLKQDGFTVIACHFGD